MKLRIESTEGEHITDLDLKDLDVEKMLQYAMLRLQKEKSDIKYKLPLKSEDVTKLLEFAITSILEDEVKKYKKPVGN
jgi:hypothetical protein